MWFGALWVMIVVCIPVPCPAPANNVDSIPGMLPWRFRTKREEVLVPDWMLAEGCHVENCVELIGREAPDSYSHASNVKTRTPLLLTDPSRIRFAGGKEVPLSSTDLREHLANALCCLVNEVTHVTDRVARAKLMGSFYENIISWLEELLIPALTTGPYVTVEEREAVSRLARDLGVLQQGHYVPAFYLDVTEARERAEERLHLQAIGVIVLCAVGSVLVTLGLVFCVLMARGKKLAAARAQGEMEPLLDSVGAVAGTSLPDVDTETSPDTSLGQVVVSRARLEDAADDYSDDDSDSRASAVELTVILEPSEMLTSRSDVTHASSLHRSTSGLDSVLAE